ncbi:hypothetical protein HOLleu_06888 [Holothuria leucospilota]|uniref:Uncharacterized protein n=1 Tax=Holothuria leucospilota TaxID=206669 RepID=A0A9Q1HJ99_HOLLE|nr:hypothetical protein HOLleu_06888 [Holothuria leucospilota]
MSSNSKMESLIPEVPSLPVYKDDSDLESSPKARQESCKGEHLKNDTRIRLEDHSYKRVKHHLAPLTKIQSTVISLTNEIKNWTAIWPKEESRLISEFQDPSPSYVVTSPALRS